MERKIKTYTFCNSPRDICYMNLTKKIGNDLMESTQCSVIKHFKKLYLRIFIIYSFGSKNSVVYFLGSKTILLE